MKLQGIYTNEDTVLNDNEFRVMLYATLLQILHEDKYRAERQEAREGYYAGRLLQIMKEGRASSTREAIRQIEAEDETSPVYRLYAETPEEAMDVFQNTYFAPGEHFVATREPAVRKAYSKYIASVLLVGLRGRWLIGGWYRLADWGFSVLPYTDKDEEVAFPYKSYEEMEGTDREAFNMLVEEYYSLCEIALYARMRLNKPVPAGEDFKLQYPTYPMELQEVEDILQDYETLTEDALKEGWDGEIYLYLPMLISRFGEAMYYALKYTGGEYKDYIESLNVAEDWDNAYKDNPESTYAKIMEE